MGIVEKIKEIEAEMARTQKNKATNGHIGMLKARVAKLRSELLDGEGGGGGGAGLGSQLASRAMVEWHLSAFLRWGSPHCLAS